MKKQLNIGVLGFGAMGKVHTYCIDNLKYFFEDSSFAPSLTAVCTTSMEKSQRIAQEYGFSYAAKSEDEMINDPQIDAICICTPNVFHYEILKKAIAANKHIYCEKPLCITAAQANEIASLAKEKGLICNIVFNNHHLAPVLRAKELIASNALGRILSFSVEYLHNSAIDPTRPVGWKHDKTVCGGGVWFDLGSHCVDLLCFLCGEMDQICGMEQIAFPNHPTKDGEKWETNADEAFYAMCRMKNGASGTMQISKITCGANDDFNISVYGETGALRFSLMQPNFLYYYDGTDPTGNYGGLRGYRAIECVGRYPTPGGIFPSPKAPSGWLQGHLQSMYNFLSSVATNTPSHPDFLDGAYVQAVLEAGYESAQNGGFVTVDAYTARS